MRRVASTRKQMYVGAKSVIRSVRISVEAEEALVALSKDLDLTIQKTLDLAILRLAKERHEGKILGVALVSSSHD